VFAFRGVCLGQAGALCTPDDAPALPRRADKGSVDVNADHLTGVMRLSLLSHRAVIVSSKVGVADGGRLPISQVTQPSLQPISRTVAPWKMPFGSAPRRESDAKGLFE